MKIAHIHLMGPYTDNWGFQENVLPAVQARQGHEVTVLTNTFYHMPDGTIGVTEPGEFMISNVKVIRLDMKKDTGNQKIDSAVMFHYPVYKQLCRIGPDRILLHGLGSGLTNFEIRKYLNHHVECKLYGDVHQDRFNSNLVRKKDVAHQLFYRWLDFCRNLLLPYYMKVLCITPNCADFAQSVFEIPFEKILLFPLGYDPQTIDWEKRSIIRARFRKKAGISENDIVIVHGGKIIPRRKTDIVINAITAVRKEFSNVKLVVFGAMSDEVKDNIIPLIEKNSDWITYLGHLSQEEYLNAYLASDIGLFPGGQSAIWQEAIGCGLPLILDKNQNVDYLDRGGNVMFANGCTPDSVADALEETLKDSKYKRMAEVAATEGREFFSYERISNLMLE